MLAASISRHATKFTRVSAKWGRLARSRRGIKCSAISLSVEVKMPALSPTMSEGQIVKWAKQEGEEINAGDVICEIQTDKAVVSLESDDDGTVARIIKGENSGAIKVGTLIAVLAEDGEDWQEVAKKSGEALDSALPSSSVQDSSRSDIEQVSGGSIPGVDIKMPALSPTMSEGTIVKWCKKEGESIAAGEVLCEIQTDKAVVALEVDDDGILAKIIVPEGETAIKVGGLIAVVVGEDENWKDVQISRVDKGTTTKVLDSVVDAEPQPTGGSTVGAVIKMPALSPTMQEGTIVKWCKKEGEKIEAGEVLCEIQTDKAVVAVEADDDAILAKIIIHEGESGIKIGSMIALMVEEGEDWTDVQIPATKRADKPSSADVNLISPEAPAASVTASQIAHVEPIPHVGPATNLLIAQYGIDPSNVQSTGPKGMLKEDIMRHIKEQNLRPVELKLEADLATKKHPEPTITIEETKSDKVKTQVVHPEVSSSYTDIPLTTMRSVIAKRLVQSKQGSPHGYSTAECNIDALSKIRNDFLNSGIKISLNDLIIKAVATTLQYVPEVNANVVGGGNDGDDFQIMPNVDISVAVATSQGLITPIVKNVPSLALPQISSTVKELANRARNGQLNLDEFQGGTFTISNLGMFGINEFTAIINPPQCAILAVGKGTLELIPHMDGKATRTMMRATLSFDRRFIDEHLASDFMATLQTVIEHPEYMNIGPVPLVRQSRAVSQL